MAYSRRQQLFPRLDQSVQYIAKLYDEEVHILARKDIARVDDLAGQKVNVDVLGSGTSMTTSVVFDALGIAAQLTNDDQRTAREKLKRGEIASARIWPVCGSCTTTVPCAAFIFSICASRARSAMY